MVGVGLVDSVDAFVLLGGDLELPPKLSWYVPPWIDLGCLSLSDCCEVSLSEDFKGITSFLRCLQLAYTGLKITEGLKVIEQTNSEEVDGFGVLGFQLL